jgi:spore maturation protein SpmA
VSAPQWNGLAGTLAAMVRIIGVAITAGTLDLQVRNEKPFIGHLFQCVSQTHQISNSMSDLSTVTE